MPNGYFVDTNVLLYTKDPKVPSKGARALEWLSALANENRIVVSPQVLNEFAHNIIRKFPHVSYDELLQNVEALRPWCVAPITDGTILHALQIHRRFRFSFYDCVLLATAMDFACEVFLSEDLTHDQQIGRLRIVNPFNVAPSAFLGQASL